MEAKLSLCLWTVLLLYLSVKSALPERVYETDEVTELIRRQHGGYKSESHLVETEDGYILKVHRIYKKNPKKVKPPVFLQHGLFASSGDFLLTGKYKALAFLLADNDYDVWLGNVRGNRFSLRHKRLSTESGKYWNFSFHEFGAYDLPAMINYMLKVTGHPRCFFTGHSQGTSTFIAMMTLRPEFNEKIIQSHLLAPAVFMSQSPHPLAGALADTLLGRSFDNYAYLDLRPYWGVATNFMKNVCVPNPMNTIQVCHNIIFSIVGGTQNNVEIDDNIVRYLLDFASPRISINQGRHYMQNFYSGGFRHFDYGWRNNAIYNSTQPPDYDLNVIKVPVYVYAGPWDLIIGLKDVERLVNNLPNAKEFKVIKNFNHLDFTYGKNARKYVYNDILRSMEQDIVENSRYSF